MKIYQLYEEPEQEMGEPETTPEPTQVDPTQGRITSLEEFKAAVPDSTIQKVILYFNRKSYETMSLTQIQTSVGRILRRMGSTSPYSVFATYIGNAGSYGRIRFPGWVRSWHQLANYFNIIAARYDADPIQMGGEQEEEFEDMSPAQKASLIKDAVVGINDGGIIIRTLLSISTNEEWEEVKREWRNFTASSENALIPRLQGELGVDDKRRFDQHLESIGSEDRLLSPDEGARMREYNLTPSGYTDGQELTTGDEIADYMDALKNNTLLTTKNENDRNFFEWLSLQATRNTAQNRILSPIMEKYEEDGKVTVGFINDRYSILLDTFYPAFATTLDD